MAFIPKNVIGRLNELSCESVAEKLGVEVIHHKALCIAHDEEHPSMAFFGENRSRWYCFSCKAGGNAIKFVQLKVAWTLIRLVNGYVNNLVYILIIPPKISRLNRQRQSLR